MKLGKTGAIVIIAAVVVAGLLILMVHGSLRKPSPASEAEALRKRLEQLRSVPYTLVTDEKVDEELSGVLIYKPDKAYNGYNIYCSRISTEVFLMDMNGKIVHQWSYPQQRVFKWNHAIMFPNGDVLVIDKYRSVLKLDWHSNLIWRRRMVAHHDIGVAEDGTLYLIVRGLETHRGVFVRFPSIVHLTSEGDEIDRWSAYEHLDDIKVAFDQRSFLDTVLDRMLATGDSPAALDTLAERHSTPWGEPETVYDYFHLNTVTVLPDTPLGRKDQRFRAGNLLTCFRNVNQIAVLDKDTKEILWVWGEGSLEWPHHPTMLEDGNILIFDNGIFRKYSRILELDPVTELIEWEYVADPPEHFFTAKKGSAQRFPNGNTLICEGDTGRAFEVTKEGEIVWEWVNPATKKGHRVQLYRVMRLSPEIVEPLFEHG